MTFVDNLRNQPIVIKDFRKGIKSIINYYQRRQKKLKALYVQQQKIQMKKQNKLVFGKTYYKIQENYRKRLKNALHILTKYIIDLCVERNIQELVVGYNPKWKQQVNLGKKVTQMFVCIPFLRIIKQLQYKSKERGIKVEIILESHTSICSFLDNEFPQHNKKYQGKRTSRGIYTTKLGFKINADVNAAYNILIKSDPNALPPRSADGVGGYVMYPRRVCVDPPGMTHTSYEISSTM